MRNLNKVITLSLIFGTLFVVACALLARTGTVSSNILLFVSLPVAGIALIDCAISRKNNKKIQTSLGFAVLALISMLILVDVIFRKEIRFIASTFVDLILQKEILLMIVIVVIVGTLVKKYYRK